MSRSNTLMGRCKACGDVIAKDRVARHLRTCFRGNGERVGFLISVEGTYDPAYWLILLVGASTKLADIDQFLRDNWLECCGHASGFRVGETHYDTLADLDDDDLFAPTDSLSLSTAVSTAMPPGSRAAYTYDFGASTELTMRVAKVRPPARSGSTVRLLAYNVPPAYLCGECGAPATQACSYCMDAKKFVCGDHVSTHPCGAEPFLPITNSPRVGVCAYAGPLCRQARWTRA